MTWIKCLPHKKNEYLSIDILSADQTFTERKFSKLNLVDKLVISH